MIMARCLSLRLRSGLRAASASSLSASSLLSASWLHQLQQLRASSLLSYEEVSAGSPTREHPTARPGRTLFVLHGLLGCGRNWRSWTRRLVEAAAASSPPGGGPWRALLLDLRCHGGSTRRLGFHPPNNMLSAAEDVSRLIRHLLGSEAPGAVLGHSMGGKVALALLQQSAAHRLAATATATAQGGTHPHPQPHPHPRCHPLLTRHVPATESASAAAAEAAGAWSSPSSSSPSLSAAAAAAAAGEWCSPPRQLWVLDSQPGLVTSEQDAGTGISRVLSTVHSVPLPIPHRAWLLRHLRERGLSDALATWLASNLMPLPPQHPHPHPHPHHPHQPHSQQPHSQQQSGAPPPTSPSESSPSSYAWGQTLPHHQHQHHPPQSPGAGAAAAAAPAPAGGGADGPFTWSFDIQCGAAMYMSYRTTELWDVLENPPYGTAVHLVQGARSDRWPEAMQRRLTQAAAAAAAAGQGSPAAVGAVGAVGVGAGCRGSFEAHVLERAGHWLHVDNPEGLLRLVLPRLSGLLCTGVRTRAVRRWLRRLLTEGGGAGGTGGGLLKGSRFGRGGTPKVGSLL